MSVSDLNGPSPAEMVRTDCRAVLRVMKAADLSPLRNQTVLVTGGTGFVGTWIAELAACLNDEHDFGLRLLLLSDRATAWAQKVPHLSRRADISLLERDVRGLRELPQDVQWILHAAGTPDNRAHATQPLRTFHTIVNGTDDVLSAASRLPDLRQILHVSSGLVCGLQPDDVERMPDNFRGMAPDPQSVTALYAEAKRAAETVCAAHRNQHRLPIVVARPFAFIGPYQLLDRPWAVNNFVRDALQGGPIRILGDGDTVRSYMYPADMAFWFLRLLAVGSPGVSYNVGSAEGVTLYDLAQKIAAQFPRPPRITGGSSGPAPHQRKSRFVPDTKEAGRLGLRLTVDLDAAIKRTISYNQRVGISAASSAPSPSQNADTEAARAVG